MRRDDLDRFGGGRLGNANERRAEMGKIVVSENVSNRRSGAGCDIPGESLHRQEVFHQVFYQVFFMSLESDGIAGQPVS